MKERLIICRNKHDFDLITDWLCDYHVHHHTHKYDEKTIGISFEMDDDLYGELFKWLRTFCFMSDIEIF